MKFIKSLFFVLSLTAVSSLVWADSPAPIDFNQTILPILQNSCFACHVYAKPNPNVKQSPELAKKMEKTIKSAIDDFEMGSAFPFPCDVPVDKQLKKMNKELSKGMMPPKSQVKLSLGSPLSDQNRKTLLAWLDQVKKAKK